MKEFRARENDTMEEEGAMQFEIIIYLERKDFTTEKVAVYC